MGNDTSTVTAFRGFASEEDHEGMSLMYQLYQEDPVNWSQRARQLSPLPENVTEQISDAIERVGNRGMSLFPDLISTPGLVIPLPGWLGITEYSRRRMDFRVNARRSMELDVRGERQMPDFNKYTVPVYATLADNSIGMREAAAMKRGNIAFDTTWTTQATFACNRQFEDQAWNGIKFNIKGNSAPGVLNGATNHFQFTGTNPAWNHDSKTGQEILNDVQGMADMAAAVEEAAEEAVELGFPGPYVLYVNNAYNNALNKKFTVHDGTNLKFFDTSIRQNLEQMQFGNQNLRVRAADMLGADQVVLIQMTPDNIDVLLGQDPDYFSWTQNNGLRQFYMVLGCAVVTVKTNYWGRNGIVVGGLPD